MRTIPLNTERRKPRVQTEFVRLNPDTGELEPEPSRTIQSDVHRSEIKEIMRNYDATGVFMSLRSVDLTFRDVTEFEDYSDMARQAKAAEQAFMTLPSKLREVFDHDHHKWLDAAHDPDKLEELRPALEKRGFLEKVVTDPAPAPREPAPEPPAGE